MDMCYNITELEFTALAISNYSNKAISHVGYPDITKVEQHLLDKGWLKWKSFKAPPNRNLYVYESKILLCSAEGKKMLERDILKLVLTLVDLEIHTYNSDVYKLINRLSPEQLPALLTHSKVAIRTAALARM